VNAILYTLGIFAEAGMTVALALGIVSLVGFILGRREKARLIFGALGFLIPAGLAWGLVRAGAHFTGTPSQHGSLDWLDVGIALLIACAMWQEKAPAA
jgi:hypothetical protein